MSCLVYDAIKARLPLISVNSPDPFYDTGIIAHMTSEACRLQPSNPVCQDEKGLVKLLMGEGTANAMGNKVVCFVGDPKDVAWKNIYQTCLEKKSTCVVLLRNGENFELGYNAGILNPPEKMVFNALKPFCKDDILIPMIMKALQGLSLSNIDAVLRLTRERDEEGAITPAGIRETRRAFVGGIRGLKIVDVNQPYYKPDQVITDWLDVNVKPFIKATMGQLIPRGMLFEGVAGTGKSAGSKYIAKELGLQLVKVELDSMMTKWSGEAEANLEIALTTLDQMAPCVALFDEIEKVISTSEDEGSSKRMLAKLLWWLQEHKSKVLVIMTTNHIDGLPQELYRPPRVDEVISLNGMPAEHNELANFLEGLCQPFVENGLKIPSMPEMMSAMSPLRYHVVGNKKQRMADAADNTPNLLYSQAEITGEFIKLVKKLNY